ncbi:MAG: ABC transporter permease [Corynebacterium sp.]|nr:ABC transporter permease [Corynebacterium sp.]
MHGFARTSGLLLGRFILTLWAASIIIFILLRIIPGDPAAVALGISATPEALAAKRAQLGLDSSLIHQYFTWIGGLIKGDLGISMTTGKDLTPIIADRAQVSAIVILCAIALALLGAIPFGIWSAVRTHRPDGFIISVLSQIGVAIPSFLFAIMGVSFFSLHLGWLPSSGWIPPNESATGFLSRLILPAIALALVQTAILARYVRSNILDVLHQDFIRTAYATGARPIRTMFQHALPNIIVPVATITGVQLSTLVAGAVVIEKIFLIPGLGSLLLDSLLNRDIMTVQTLIMMLVAFCLAVNVIVDLIAASVDPRLRSAR